MITLKKTHRQRQKEDTKDLILNAAYKLFAERGYADTTMRLLAKEAGVGLGTILNISRINHLYWLKRIRVISGR